MTPATELPWLYDLMFSAIDLVPPLLPDTTRRLDAPTPCTNFTVEGLLQHLQVTIRRTQVLGQRKSADSVPLGTEAERDYVGAWERYSAAAKNTWRGLPESTILTAPWGTMTAASVSALYAAEFVVHAWDLARALERDVVVEDNLARHGLLALRQALPVENRDLMFSAAIVGPSPAATLVDRPFANAQAMDPQMSPLNQLIAWSGRDIEWTPQNI